MMSWQTYRLVFRLESPLHIGWRKIGNLMQTRYYVPGRIWWGAVTANLTRWSGQTDYNNKGEWVWNNLRFGYFFPAEAVDTPLYPVQDDGRTVYGNGTWKMEETEFERYFLSSSASTAIAYQSNSAEDGSLHEVEFIKPYLDLERPVYLVGHLFVRQNNEIVTNSNDVKINGLSLFSQVMSGLQIGGERRYGFGRLTLCQTKCQWVNAIFGCQVDTHNGQCCVTVSANNPLLAHTKAEDFSEDSPLQGSIEPIISREWNQSGPGRGITLVGLCYVPGAVVTSETTFTIERYGIWKKRS